jgi:predicted phage terminase large subunit-like protein
VSDWFRQSPAGTIRRALDEIARADAVRSVPPGEQRRRDEARNGLLPFVQYTTAGYEPAAIHRIVADALDSVERGEIDRLMLLAWPQSGKSQVCSRRYPAYLLGRNPRHDVISASATASLAESFGADVRNCVDSREYAQVFPGTRLAEDTRSKGLWQTSGGGRYLAVGIGGAVMGRGATRVVIDDPFASMEDAQSALQRDRVWDWYRGTLYNRVRPGGAIVLVQHRMHEDDLAGRLLAEQGKGGKDHWTVVELPALKDGVSLWPERFTVESLERLKANMPPAYWSSLYLQNPVPDEGLFFKREWFKFYDPQKLPGNLRKYISSDFAVTDGGGDFTSIGVHGVDSTTSDLYLAIESYSGQTTADVWIDELIGMVQRHRPLALYGEAGPIRRSIEPFLAKRMQERSAWCRIEWITSIADKATRARALQARASMGKVYMPDTEAGHRILHQLLGFPLTKHDDDVDMCAQFVRAVDENDNTGFLTFMAQEVEAMNKRKVGEANPKPQFVPLLAPSTMRPGASFRDIDGNQATIGADGRVLVDATIVNLKNFYASGFRDALTPGDSNVRRQSPSPH